METEVALKTMVPETQPRTVTMLSSNFDRLLSLS